jgi:uncharacterized protein (DUF362 family)
MTPPRPPEPQEREAAVPDLSRRDVLKMAALGLGAIVANAVLAACGSRSSTASLWPTSTLTPSAPPKTPTPLPATPIPTPTPSPSVNIPDLVVVRNGEPAALVRRAIAALGGMERFVPQGAGVVVKPNICVAYRTYEYAATTNPWVVGELVRMAFEAGASSVKVLDYPYGGSGADAYVKSGIQEHVQAAGGEMVVMSSRKFVSTPIPGGKWLKQTDVYDEILKADVLINVPIAKVHGSSRMTAAMKNLMGIVRDRPTMHGKLGQAIADLNTLVKPDLTVLDAVRILTANGPSGGKLSYVKKLDTVVAGTDVVATDAYAATLLGLEPTDLDYVKIGAAMGLGQSDLSKLNIEVLSA